LAFASIFFTTQDSSGVQAGIVGPMRMVRVSILLLLAMWAGMRLLNNTGRFNASGSAALLMLLYSVLAMLSALYSPIPALTLWKGFEVFAVMLMIVAMSDLIKTRSDIQWLFDVLKLIILFFVCDLVFSVLIAPGQAFANFEVSTGRMAFAAHGISPNLHPNSATQMGAFLVALTVASLLNEQDKRLKIIKWVLIAFGLTAIIVAHLFFHVLFLLF